MDFADLGFPRSQLATLDAGAVLNQGVEMSLTDTDEGMTVTLRGNAEIVARDFFLTADAIRIRFGFQDKDRKKPSMQSIYAEGTFRVQ